MNKELDKTMPELKPLIYFQNLVPGKQESPFIDRYKSECLNDENEQDHKMRSQLLNEFPPVLSFDEKQKKKFYEEESVRCQQFCCGFMHLSSDLSGNYFLKPQDSYMLSIGNGKLYEGNSEHIKGEMQADVHQEPFGSAKQEQIISGIKQFDAIVAQREEDPSFSKSPESNQKSEDSGHSPFKTEPNPFNE